MMNTEHIDETATVDGKSKRQRAKNVEPTEYFSGWCYSITRAHWPALGVTLREYVDSVPTKTARERAKAAGWPPEDVKRIKIMMLSHGVMSPPYYEFHLGDIFHAHDGLTSLQIMNVAGEMIEAHQISAEPKPRRAYKILAHELAEWLRTGNPPTHGRIGPMDSARQVVFSSIEPVN